MKKLFACTLIVCLILSFGLISAAAQKSVSNISLKVSADKVHEGDTFTVTLSTGAMTVTTFTGGLSFPTNMLECVSVKGGKSTNPVLYDTEKFVARLTCSTPEEANQNGNVGFFNIGTGDTAYEAGDFAIITFRAKKTGSVRFAVYEDSDGKDGFRSEITPSGAPVMLITVVQKGAVIPTDAPSTQTPGKTTTPDPGKATATPVPSTTPMTVNENTPDASETPASQSPEATGTATETSVPGTATDAPADATAQPDETSGNGFAWWIIPLIAVVVIGGGVAVFVIVKRSKKDQ